MEWKTPLDAIADPIRLRLMRVLARHGRGTLTQVAKRADVHPNTARTHLAELADAGLVDVGVATGSESPGRPPNTYALAEGWTPPATDFRGLAEVLAAVAVHARVKPRRLRSIGSEWGRYLAGRPRAADPAETIPAAMARLGFDARVERERVCLAGCPCPLVSPDRPELVCELARGAVDGVLAASGSDVRVRRATNRPPERRCELEVT
jgi:predicted ArsR family transcriptional regulator